MAVVVVAAALGPMAPALLVRRSAELMAALAVPVTTA
jgi:hypothetical protein